MKLHVEFECDNCLRWNQSYADADHERDARFFSLDDAVRHVREHPDHFVEAFVTDDRRLIEVGLEVGTPRA